MAADSDYSDEISDLYKRTEQAQLENALNKQRIDSHETQCIAKHNQVLEQVSDIKGMVRGLVKWGVGLLTSILFLLIGILLK